MEQKVKGCGSVGLSGMTGNRRELPPSRLAGHRRAVPHRTLEGSPGGRTHPLVEVERFDGQALLRGCSVAIA
jgi:hypothetical protein